MSNKLDGLNAAKRPEKRQPKNAFGTSWLLNGHARTTPEPTREGVPKDYVYLEQTRVFQAGVFALNTISMG